MDLITKKIGVFVLLFSAFVFANAQKIAYVDSEYILSKMPAYQAAQKEVDNIAQKWQKELEGKYKNIDQLYKSYIAEKPLLTDELKKKKEEEIMKAEQEAKDFQKKKFGHEGELFQKRMEKIKPVQDKVMQAINDVAKVKGFDMIIDKSGGTLILYSNSKFDFSNFVLQKLGISTK